MRGRGTLTLRREDGRIVCESCTVADTTLRRMRGLLGRGSLRSGEGIVLRPAWSIHTAFMRFPIDVVFLDENLEVVRLDADVRAWKALSHRGAREIVELPAGECKRRGLEVGHRVAWAALPSERELADRLAVGRTQAPEGDEPRKVLVASSDRSFARLLGFMLARNGIESQIAPHAERVLDVLDRERVDAVVLDAPDSLVSAAKTRAAAQALHPDVRFFVVAENGGSNGATDLVVFDKWDGMDEIVEAVGAALETPAGA